MCSCKHTYVLQAEETHTERRNGYVEANDETLSQSTLYAKNPTKTVSHTEITSPFGSQDGQSSWRHENYRLLLELLTSRVGRLGHALFLRRTTMPIEQMSCPRSGMVNPLGVQWSVDRELVRFLVLRDEYLCGWGGNSE